MSWKTAALLTLTSFGLGYLVYLLFKQDEDDETHFHSKTINTSIIEVKIPNESIGFIIGRGGNTIKEIESQSDVKIYIKEKSSASEDYKICIIKGTQEATQYAESLIHELIVNQPLIETFEMFVPAHSCGRIIGKNGDNIRLISRNSNAKITIEKPSTSSLLERKIIIKGTSEQIATAKLLVEQKIEEDLDFRKKIESQVSNRSPRNKPKYLLPSKGESEEFDTNDQKQKFIATGSNGLLEVYVSAVESPDRLWVQMMGPSTVELDRLIEQMTDYYKKEENKMRHKLGEVKCGQIVAAPFSYDDMWYRAEVQEIQNDVSEPFISLYYVDYGDSSNCKKCDIYELRTDFLKLRFQAIECMLAKVKPREACWTEEAIDFFGDLTHVAMWKSLRAKIHTYKERSTRIKREGSPVPCVELYDAHEEKTVNIAEELVAKGFAVWEDKNEPPKLSDACDVQNGDC